MKGGEGNEEIGRRAVMRGWDEPRGGVVVVVWVWEGQASHAR